MILTAVLMAALMQGGSPHFSDAPDVVSTPGANQAAPAPLAKAASPVVVTGAAAVKPKLTAYDLADKVVCKTQAATGTLIASTQCLTNAQWAQWQQDSKDDYDKAMHTGAWGVDGLTQSQIAGENKLTGGLTDRNLRQRLLGGSPLEPQDRFRPANLAGSIASRAIVGRARLLFF